MTAAAELRELVARGLAARDGHPDDWPGMQRLADEKIAGLLLGVEELALEWEQDAQGFALYDDRDKAQEAQERAQRLRAALAPVQLVDPVLCSASHEVDGAHFHCLVLDEHDGHVDSQGRPW